MREQISYGECLSGLLNDCNISIGEASFFAEESMSYGAGKNQVPLWLRIIEAVRTRGATHSPVATLGGALPAK